MDDPFGLSGMIGAAVGAHLLIQSSFWFATFKEGGVPPLTGEVTVISLLLWLGRHAWRDAGEASEVTESQTSK